VIRDLWCWKMIVLGHYESLPYKTEKSYKCCMCSDCSINWLFLCFSPSFWTALFLGHNSIKVKPTNNPACYMFKWKEEWHVFHFTSETSDQA
jgi:hypothetical protein